MIDKTEYIYTYTYSYTEYICANVTTVQFRFDEWDSEWLQWFCCLVSLFDENCLEPWFWTDGLFQKFTITHFCQDSMRVQLENTIKYNRFRLLWGFRQFVHNTEFDLSGVWLTPNIMSPYTTLRSCLCLFGNQNEYIVAIYGR